MQDQPPPETDADAGDTDGQAPAALRWLAAASITALGVAALVILGLTLATIARMAA